MQICFAQGTHPAESYKITKKWWRLSYSISLPHQTALILNNSLPHTLLYIKLSLEGRLYLRASTAQYMPNPWEDTGCFRAQRLPYKVTRDHLKPRQRMGPDPGVCIPPLFSDHLLLFPLPPFVVCLRRDKYLPSFFGLQYVIPSGNQRLEFKRWSLLTFDPGASHSAALSPWKWIVKWKNGSRQSLQLFTHHLTPPHPQREWEEDEWISFINKQAVKKNGLLAEKQAQEGQKEKECQGKRGRGVRRLVRRASYKFSKAKTTDKKLYHRFPREEYLQGDGSFRRGGLWLGAPLL